MTKYPVTFTDPQFAFLKRTAQKLGISIAEYVRRIVDTHMGKTIIVFALALSAVACGDSSIAPSPAASLEARTPMTLVCDNGPCRFEGTAVNSGNGCAINVTGVVTIRTEGQPDVTMDATISQSMIRPGPFTYAISGSKVDIIRQWLLRGPLPVPAATFEWRNVACR